MSNQPLISIIIPTYNRAYFLKETLASVSMQTYTHWECLVIDDGSADDTATMVQSFVDQDKRFQYHQRPDTFKSGGNGARNFGFELSKGQFVQWFDDDDVMLPNFLEAKVKALDSDTDLVFCGAKIVNTALEGQALFDLTIKESLFKDYLLWNFQVITNSVLIKSDYLKGRTLFLETISRGQENEFFSRLFFKKHDQFSIVNEPLFLYRQHGKTKTERNKSYVHDYKSSLKFIYLENLKRAFQIRDSVLATFFYYALTRLFFEGLKFQDKKNVKAIAGGLTKIFFKHVKRYDAVFLFNILALFNINSYKLYKYLSSRKINLS